MIYGDLANLAMYGDNFDSFNSAGANGIWQHRDVAEHPTVQGQLATTKNSLTPNVNSPGVEKSCF